MSLSPVLNYYYRKSCVLRLSNLSRMLAIHPPTAESVTRGAPAEHVPPNVTPRHPLAPVLYTIVDTILQSSSPGWGRRRITWSPWAMLSSQRKISKNNSKSQLGIVKIYIVPIFCCSLLVDVRAWRLFVVVCSYRRLPRPRSTNRVKSGRASEADV